MNSTTKHVPLRTCVVCRKKRAKHELFRLTASRGEVLWDRFYRLPGRGAYVCRNKECVSRLRTLKSLQKALRRNDAMIARQTIERMIEEIDTDKI